MNSVLNILDTSKLSLGISFIIFVIVIFVSKYLLDKNINTEDDEIPGWANTIYSVIIGLASAFLSLGAFKYINRENHDILIEPFYSKINIV